MFIHGEWYLQLWECIANSSSKKLLINPTTLKLTVYLDRIQILCLCQALPVRSQHVNVERESRHSFEGYLFLSNVFLKLVRFKHNLLKLKGNTVALWLLCIIIDRLNFKICQSYYRLKRDCDISERKRDRQRQRQRESNFRQFHIRLTFPAYRNAFAYLCFWCCYLNCSVKVSPHELCWANNFLFFCLRNIVLLLCLFAVLPCFFLIFDEPASPLSLSAQSWITRWHCCNYIHIYWNI